MYLVSIKLILVSVEVLLIICRSNIGIVILVSVEVTLVSVEVKMVCTI